MAKPTDLFSTGVIPAFNQHILDEAEKRRDYGEYWSASSAGFCKRLLIFRRLGVPMIPEQDEKRPITQRVFSSGHIFHEWAQRITKDAGLSIASEDELKDEDLKVIGHFDDLIDVDGHKILYDYKTAHSESFKYAQGRPMGHYHKMQLGTYLYMLRKQHPDLTEGRILTISKDDLRMSEKSVMWNPLLEKDVKDYWKELNKFWDDKKIPPCTCLDYDGGFMGRRTTKGKLYNDYFYNEIPCNIEWYDKWKAGDI